MTEAWGEWIAQLRDWDVFGGMTFDQRRAAQERIWKSSVVTIGRRVSRDVAVKRFHRWIDDASGVLGRRIEYVAALEYQKNGWPHFHPLLDVGELQQGDISRLGRTWWRLAGGSQLSRPRNTLDVSRYSAKYLAKDLAVGDVLLSKGLASALTIS